VYSIKLLPTERNARYSAGSEEYLSLIRTLIRAPRKTQDATTPGSLHGKIFSVLFEKTRNPPGGRLPARRSTRRPLRAAATWLPVKPRDSIGSIKAGNRTERRNKVNPVAEGAAPIDTPVSLAK